MERPTASDMMPKRDHERDLELDKKIEALRRKNEALMKRHKEVEEDRKRAEEEGMALQSRKGKAEDLTITISKSTSDSRVVVTKPFSGAPPAGKGQQEAGTDTGGEGPPQSAGRGHRKQLMVTMAGKKGKRTVSERAEKRPGPSDIKSPTDDGQTRRVESAGRPKQPLHMTRRDTPAQDGVKQGQKLTEEQHTEEQNQEPESLQASTDLNIPTSREEQEEYVRWKKEREQIDRERVARHKNAKGQWRRAWDVDKTESMFSDKSLPDRDWGASGRGGRNARRGQSRAGHEKRGKDKGAKSVLVMSSKAKGIDRLTGRARRWQANEDGENLQSADTTIEEFLEELDALTDPEADDHKDEDVSEAVSVSSSALAEGKAEASSPRGSEKKVRFSEELVQGAHTKQSTGSQNSTTTDASSPHNKQHDLLQESQQPLQSTKQDDGPQDQGGGPPPPPPPAPPAPQQQASEHECTVTDSSSLSPAPCSADKACAELAKFTINNTNTEELIDSGLSVLSLESRESHPTHSTSSDKAREHGRIV